MQRVKALWICTCAALAALTLQCGTDEGPGPNDELTVIPQSVSLEVSSTQQFTVDCKGETPEVRWYVNGVRGGTPSVGMVTLDGVYVSPGEIPPGGTVTLRARAVEDTTLDGTATARIVKSETTPYVTVSPETVSVSASDSIQFSSQVFDCSSEDVIWSLENVWGDPSSQGSMRPSGMYVAPFDVDFNFTLLIQAGSVTCPGKVGIAKVAIFAPSREFRVELESFTDKYDVEGSLPIRAESCSGASGGRAVKGMDSPGEWIKVPIHVAGSGLYVVSVRYQANPGSVIELTIGNEGCGPSGPGVAVTLDEGDGMG